MVARTTWFTQNDKHEPNATLRYGKRAQRTKRELTPHTTRARPSHTGIGHDTTGAITPLDASTANRAEALDDIVNIAEKNQVSSIYIIGNSRSALDCRAPPNAIVATTLATRGVSVFSSKS